MYRLIAPFLALLLTVSAGCTPKDGPDASPAPDLSGWVTVEDLAPEVVELSFPFHEWGASMCADGEGNVWITNYDARAIYQLDARRNQGVFAECQEPLTDIAYMDGRIYALAHAESGSEIIIYDESGLELERHPLGHAGASGFAPIVNTGKVFVYCFNTDVDGLLYDTATRASETLDLDLKVANITPLSNGEAVIFVENDYRYLLKPLESMSEPVDRGFYTQWAKYDVFTGVVYAFDGGVYVRRSAAENGELLMPCDNIWEFFYTAAANDRVYAYIYEDDTPKLKIYDFSAARPQLAMKTTLTVGGNVSLANAPLLNEYIERFEREHPYARVKYLDRDEWSHTVLSEYGYEYIFEYDRLFLNLVSGEVSVDLMLFSDSGAEFPVRTSSMLRDLNEFPKIREMMDSDRLFDGIKELCTGGLNGLYGVVVRADSFVWVANKELFAKLGVPLPTPDWTWRDFLDIAERAYRDENGDGRSDIYLPLWDFAFPSLITSSFNENNDYLPKFNSPEYIEYAERYFKLAELYNNLDTVYYDDSWNGKMPDGNTLFSRLRLDDLPGAFNDSLLLLPEPEFFEVPISLPYFAGIPRGAQNAELAAEFIAGFLSEEHHRAHAGYGNMIYKDLASYDKLEFPETAAVEAHLQRHFLSLSKVFFPKGFSEWVYDELFPRYKSGELTMEQCAALLQQEAEKRALG